MRNFRYREVANTYFRRVMVGLVNAFIEFRKE